MGVNPWHNWDAHYEVLRAKKVVNELKQLAEKADHIYLATDLDREGEAIAWHLRVIGVMTTLQPCSVQRNYKECDSSGV